MMVLDVVLDKETATLRETTPVAGIRVVRLPVDAWATHASDEGQADDRPHFAIHIRRVEKLWSVECRKAPQVGGIL